MGNFVNICLILVLITALSAALPKRKDGLGNGTGKGRGKGRCLKEQCCCGGVCAVTKGNKVICRCPQFCTLEHKPVCGSDGITYSNECKLRVAACQQQDPNLIIEHPGTCLTPCATIKCGYYATCKVEDGTAKCVCNEACPEILSPVCGTDGDTYDNECLLKLESCKTQTAIEVQHDGPCKAKRCPNAYNTACFAPCFPKVCEKKNQICCCTAGDACEDCTTPVYGVKTCPTIKLLCSSDSDCAKDHECCQNGCAKTCMPKV